MKIILILVTTLLTASFYISSRSAAQRFDPLGKNAKLAKDAKPINLRIYFESYELTAIQYAEIMHKAKSTTNQTELRNQLFQQCKEGKIKLVSNHSLVCRPSERAVVESILEYIYPTEIEPLGNGLYDLSGKQDKARELKPTPKKNNHPILPPIPTAFETRNIGTMIEVEPALGENGIIELKLKPEIVEHVGDSVTSVWDLGFVQAKPSNPLFYTLRTDTSLTIVDGEFLLYATYTPHLKGKPDNTRKILNFVRAEILTTHR